MSDQFLWKQFFGFGLFCTANVRLLREFSFDFPPLVLARDHPPVFWEVDHWLTLHDGHPINTNNVTVLKSRDRYKRATAT
jgi:hypothetical protein